MDWDRIHRRKKKLPRFNEIRDYQPRRCCSIGFINEPGGQDCREGKKKNKAVFMKFLTLTTREVSNVFFRATGFLNEKQQAGHENIIQCWTGRTNSLSSNGVAARHATSHLAKLRTLDFVREAKDTTLFLGRRKKKRKGNLGNFYSR